MNVLSYTDFSENLDVFDALCDLFRKRESIPGDSGFPNVKPPLDDFTLPSHFLDDVRLDRALAPERLQRIRQSLIAPTDDAPIQYQALEDDESIIRRACVDMIFSQAVLEHVDQLEATYAEMGQRLKPGSYMSLQIDFKCHGWANQWNGHWRYPDWVWRTLRGKRSFAINRQPYSRHVSALSKSGFKVIGQQLAVRDSALEITDLANAFRNMTEDDLVTSGAFVQVVN